MRIMMLGNPNAGKTSLFNALTHQRQKVANWSGVTVAEHCAPIAGHPEQQLIDLPGIYSLSSSQGMSLDMQLASQALRDNPPDLILNVVNATQLERHLFLSSQLLELGIPMIIVLTHMDILAASHQILDSQALSLALGIPVFAAKNYQMHQLKDLLQLIAMQAVTQAKCMPWPHQLLGLACQDLEPSLELFRLRRMLESGSTKSMHEPLLAEAAQAVPDLELCMMDARYQFVHQLATRVLPHGVTALQILTRRLDRWFLHKIWGWPIFFLILWFFFSIAVRVGGAIQLQLSEASTWFFNTVIESGMSALSTQVWPKWVVVNGLGQGVTTMLSFMPVMALMNAFLSLMESSGYMARVAFLFERIMRQIGLPGKAFLPLLIGFGCNVPAIMSARIVEGSKERLLTVLLSPFMSCSARLTIYAVFASLFFPQHGGWVVLSLYLLGVVMAIFTGYVLRRYWLSGTASPNLLELPCYQKPELSRLYRDVVLRLKLFMIRSGKVILPFCMLLGAIQAGFESGVESLGVLQNMLWQIWVHVLHPILAPIGIRMENWPAAIGLLTGTMAKEVVVATLNTLYNHIPDLGLSQASLLAMGSSHATESWTVALYSAFGDSRAAYAYLLFVLLYIPCISTLAIIGQEIGRFWQWFAFIWSLILAYSVASLFYMSATIFEHPSFSLIWGLGLLGFWVLLLQGFKYWRPMHVT